MDVVPVTQESWSVEAFDAVEDEQKTLVYGRGALDVKATVIVSLLLINESFCHNITTLTNFSSVDRL